MKMRVVSLALMLAAAVVAAAAVAMTGWGRPDPTVLVGGGVGSTVQSVVPGGPLWRAGIRNGQTVLELVVGVEERGWLLVTSDGAHTYSVSYRSLELALREAIGGAVVALALATLAWVLVRRLEMAAVLAAISLIVGGQTLLYGGSPIISTAAGVGATVAPAIWVSAWGNRARAEARLGLRATALVAAAWVGVRFAAPGLYEPLDLLRQAAMAGGVLGMAVMLANWRRWRGRGLPLERARIPELVALVGVVGVVAAAALVADLPAFLVVVVGGAAILLYPAVRRRLATTVDQLLFGEIRGRATLQAVEDERGRIARDLHDAPLQEIAAVIRELDRRPDAEAEADLLRSAAGHLRRVTTELRPPVLDDLGLKAGLAYVAEQAAARAPGVDVRAMLIPDDPVAPRPPADVELAVFRIVHEAVDNALRHGAPTTVALTARVTESEVDVTVEDDGAGINARAAREAARNGHIGLPTMAQRAAVIGATFSVGAARPRGTVVRVEWRSPA